MRRLRRGGLIIWGGRPRRLLEQGSVAVEILAVFSLISLIALGVLQVAIAGQTAVAAQTAARGASQAAAMGGGSEEVEAAAKEAVDPSLRPKVRIVARSGTRVTVSVAMPIVVPGLSTDAWSVTRSAEFPET